ncbi:MAG TPA: hypothetical protein VM369_02325 [Candidatus Binatia bacterium]|nr:hypothetical protein [Candidatus Binatia bacterium]
MISKAIRTAAAAAAALVAAGAQAGSQSNTMTNIATVADACDIVAVGVDFGITTVPLPATGIIAVTPNTSLGNLVTGNTSHPSAAVDGGAGNDDTLSLATPISALNSLISPLLSGVVGALPGLYVACTTSPTSVQLLSAAAGAVSYNLPISLGGLPVGTYSGRMTGVGGGATGANSIDYTMTFIGSPVSTAVGGGFPLSVFIGAFTVTGTIPAAQSGTIVPGYYRDSATAQVNF